MKIREYNEMMRYLTRPKEKFKGTFVKQKNNTSTKPSFKDKTPLKVAALPPGTDRVKMAKGSTPNPRIMVNYANPNIFEGLNPEDDDLLEKMKLRVANAKIPSSIKEYTDTEKELRQFDNLDKTTYPSDPKVRETLFQDILPRLQKKDVKKIVKAEQPKPNGVDPDPPTNIVPFPFDQANEKPWYESMNNKETVEEYLARKEIEFQKSGAELEALRYGIGTLFRKKI